MEELGKSGKTFICNDCGWLCHDGEWFQPTIEGVRRFAEKATGKLISGMLDLMSD